MKYVLKKVQVNQLQIIYILYSCYKLERSRIRKTQVHPTVVNSSESGRKDHDAAHLFIVNKESNTKPSSLSKANSMFWIITNQNIKFLIF